MCANYTMVLLDERGPKYTDEGRLGPDILADARSRAGASGTTKDSSPMSWLGREAVDLMCIVGFVTSVSAAITLSIDEDQRKVVAHTVARSAQMI